MSGGHSQCNALKQGSDLLSRHTHLRQLGVHVERTTWCLGALTCIIHCSRCPIGSFQGVWGSRSSSRSSNTDDLIKILEIHANDSQRRYSLFYSHVMNIIDFQKRFKDLSGEASFRIV